MENEWIKCKEWIDVNTKLPEGKGDVVTAKRKDGSVVKCYYHSDKMDWLASYTRNKTSHFQDHRTLEFLHDVTHWRKLNE